MRNRFALTRALSLPIVFALAPLSAAQAQDTQTLEATLITAAMPSYDDAPLTPDADDPAIWVNPADPSRSLVIGTLKNAGLVVFDLAGHRVQAIQPPNHEGLSAQDPPVPGVSQPLAATSACPESESGETFGRYNNVSVLAGFQLRVAGRSKRVDIAVVTDRGCDRLRVYAIDPQRSGGPLFDISDALTTRVFPNRIVQPSPVQPAPDLEPGFQDNPLDDQNTAYGIALYRTPRGEAHAFVTQRSRARVVELELYDAGRGTVGYRPVREFRFPSTFTIPRAKERGVMSWTACREDAEEDPQLEGLAVDADYQVLYAAQEVIGAWKIPLSDRLPRVVDVPQSLLIEPVKTFGAPYWAVPDEDEFSCEGESPADEDGRLPPGTIAAAGNARLGGTRVTADVEGITVYYGAGRAGYVVISSQGDSTFHLFERSGGFTRATANRYLTSFAIAGVGDTDGVELTSAALGSAFPSGLVVVQNGEAPDPADTSAINGFDYDNSTQFELIDFRDVAALLP